MVAWNGEEDRFITSDKDTWESAPKTDEPIEHGYLQKAELPSEDYVKGAVRALEYAADMVNRRCYPSWVGDRLKEEAEAIKAEWENRQK